MHRRSVGAALALIVLLATVYATTLRGEFVWDDRPLIEHNPSLLTTAGWKTLFTRDFYGGAGLQPTQIYRPLPLLSLWAGVRLHGMSIVGLRVVSLALHAACVLALGRWLLRHLRDPRAALVGALFAALHPLAVEPVLWLSSRPDLVVTLLALVGLHRTESPSRRDLVGLALVGFGGFLSKESAVVFPALFGLAAAFEARAAHRSPRVAISVTLATVAGLALAVGLRLALHISLRNDATGLAPWRHLAPFGALLAHYLRLALTGADEATVHAYAPPAVLPALALGLGVVSLAVGAALAARTRPTVPLALGAAWFVVTVAPLVAVVPVLGLWGNRYGYLPLMGVAMAVGVGVDTLVTRAARMRPLVLGGAALVLALLGFSSHASARLWRDDLTLYRASVAQHPDDGVAHYHLGVALHWRGGCLGSLASFEEATRLAPDYARGWFNVASCRLTLGDARAALAPAERAFALAPARAGYARQYAAVLALHGRRDDARRMAQIALRVDPHDATAAQILTESSRVTPRGVDDRGVRLYPMRR